jgi:DNA repair protein RadA/Sms
MSKYKWICRKCAYESPAFIGKCTGCNSWGSLEKVEIIKNPSENKGPKNSLFVNSESQILTLNEIPDTEIYRISSKSEELDRVLGGGLVPGSLTLIGGQPGIGKSTLLLQVTNNFSIQGFKVLYLSAEESSQQVKIRATRLGINDANPNILVYTENNLAKIIKSIKENEINIVIIDSIQAIYQPDIDSIPGSMTQIRESCSNLMRLAKNTGIPILIVGHINKEGDLAGPKILEHMVDTVLQFEGEREQDFRILRTIKNRFGSTDEIGIFQMDSDGLKDLKNPSACFLEERSGGLITVTREGKRNLLLEIQSLVICSEYNNPRRLANGIDINRLHQILAVLEKNFSMNLMGSDVYINVVGGFHIKEPAADLAIALSIYASAQSMELPKDLIAIGEIGLNGEIRSTSNLESRLKEAYKLGFKEALIARSSLESIESEELKKELNLSDIENINEINRILKNPKTVTLRT